jgi:hypothetical protein
VCGHALRLDVVLLGRLEVGVAEQIGRDADLLGRAVDQFGDGTIPKQMRPDRLAEGLPGARLDLLVNRPAAHGAARAADPKVPPDAANLTLAHSNRLEHRSVSLKPALHVRRQLLRHGGMIGSPGLGLRRSELQAVVAAVEHQVLADHQAGEVLERHRACDEKPDDQAVAVAGRLRGLVLAALAGVHQPQPEREQVRGADQAGELVARWRRGLLEAVVDRA